MAQNTPAISVIVPCYNVEKYLEICLNSLKAQTFKDFEVLIIDDVSTDSSGQIAKSYAEDNIKFTYYLIEKGGLGGARNFGLSHALGEYVAFVDSDDRVAPDYLEKLYSCAKKTDADMVCCNYVKYYEKNKKHHEIKYRKQKQGVYTPKQMKKLLLNDFTVRSYAWNKMCRKSLFIDNNIQFPKMYFEDIATSIRLAHYSNKIAAIEDPLYYYSIRQNSIMTSCIVGKYNDYAKAFAICINFLEHNGGIKGYRFNIINLGKSVLFANLYSIVKIHYKEHSPKGLLQNFYYCIKTVFNCANLGEQSYDNFPDSEYAIKHPQYFKTHKSSNRLIFSYSEEEAISSLSGLENNYVNTLNNKANKEKHTLNK